MTEVDLEANGEELTDILAKKREKSAGDGEQALEVLNMNAEEIKEKWLNIQKRSYTNWLNEVLRPTGEVVNDVVDDIGNGVLLCKLTMLLTMKRLRYQKNPRLLFQRQDNIQKSLNLLEQSGCKLVNIGASDIMTKNTKLILGLLWQLVQHFHVFQSIKNVRKMNRDMKGEKLMGNLGEETDEFLNSGRIENRVDIQKTRGRSTHQVKKQILADINRRLERRGFRVDNLTTDWRSGDALCALVDYNVRGIYDLYQDSDAVLKVAESMIAAHKFLGIPQLVEPEDFISNLIDEQTMSMYISCFVHDGIEEISVNLFDDVTHDMMADEEEEGELNEGTVDVLEFIKAQEAASSKKPLISNVTQFIQNQNRPAPATVSLADVVFNKMPLPDPTLAPSKHSLTEILSPTERHSHSSSSEIDEGIGADIMADVSFQYNPIPRESIDVLHLPKVSPTVEVVTFDEEEEIIGTVSLESSLQPDKSCEDEVDIEMEYQDNVIIAEKVDVADILEEEMFLAEMDSEEEEELMPPPRLQFMETALEMSAPTFHDEDICPESPGEIEPVNLELVSPNNQEEIRQKLDDDLKAAISDGIFAIYGEADTTDNEVVDIVTDDQHVDLDESFDRSADEDKAPIDVELSLTSAVELTPVIESEIGMENSEASDSELAVKSESQIDLEFHEVIKTCDSENLYKSADTEIIPPPADFGDVAFEELEIKLLDAEVSSQDINLSADETDSATFSEDSVGALDFDVPSKENEYSILKSECEIITYEIKDEIEVVKSECEIITSEIKDEIEVVKSECEIITCEIKDEIEVVKSECEIITSEIEDEIKVVKSECEIITYEIKDEIEVELQPSLEIETDVEAEFQTERQGEFEAAIETGLQNELEFEPLLEIAAGDDKESAELQLSNDIDTEIESVLKTCPEADLDSNIENEFDLKPQQEIKAEINMNSPELQLPDKIEGKLEHSLEGELHFDRQTDVEFESQQTAFEADLQTNLEAGLDLDLQNEIILERENTMEAALDLEPSEIQPSGEPDALKSCIEAVDFEHQQEIKAEINIKTPEFQLQDEIEAATEGDLENSFESDLDFYNQKEVDFELDLQDETKLEHEYITVANIDVKSSESDIDAQFEAEIRSDSEPGLDGDIESDLYNEIEVELQHQRELEAAPIRGLTFESSDASESDNEALHKGDAKSSPGLDLEDEGSKRKSYIAVYPNGTFEIPPPPAGDYEDSDSDTAASFDLDQLGPSIDLKLSDTEIETEKESSETELRTSYILDDEAVEYELELPVQTLEEREPSIDLHLDLASSSSMELRNDNDIDITDEKESSIKVGFSSQSSDSNDIEMTIPVYAEVNVFEREFSIDSKESKDSSPEMRSSVAESPYSTASRSSTSKGFAGSITSGGDEISLASSTKSKSLADEFPLMDARLVVLINKMSSMSEGYTNAKELFRKFIVRSDVEWTTVPFLKCCLFMRSYLLTSFFQILGAGEHVMFDDLPLKKDKRSSTKKKMKAAGKNDPLLAQLPNTLNMNQSAERQVVPSKKLLLRQKKVANQAINLYTNVVQLYENYKAIFVATNESYEGRVSDLKEFSDIMEKMQNEIMMATMILTGLCLPD